MHRLSNVKNCLTLGAIASVLLFAGVFLLSGKVMAEDDTDVIDQVDLTVPVACTFTAGGGTYSGTMTSGQSITIDGNNITTSCNDANGYALYAIGFSGDTYSGNYHTDLISSQSNDYNIKTDGSGTYGSSWKMKLTVVANATLDNSYGSFQNVPSSFARVAYYTSNTTAGTVTPTYQITASGSQPAGSYAGAVKYVLVHPSTYVAGAYNIAYNANGGSGTTTGHTGIYNFDPVTLRANSFTAPTGYEFAGWCTAQDQTQTPQTTCNGALYRPGDEVVNLGTANSTANLYAIWNALPTMQDFATNNQCTSLSTGDTLALVDSRDGTSYLISKLADGKCWMLDNLALDLTSSTVLNSMSDTNTNASAVSLNYLKNGGGTTSDQYATAAVANWASSSSSFSAPLLSISGDCANSSYCANSPQTGKWTKDSRVIGYGEGSKKIGIYYNFCAASAGSYCYGDGGSAGTSSGNATEDICPAGWHMPSGYTNGEFGVLYSYYNTTTTASNSASLQYNLSVPLSGHFYNQSSGSQNAHGSLWSSTRADNYSMYTLDVSSSSVNVETGDDDDRDIGYTLRCVTGS